MDLVKLLETIKVLIRDRYIDESYYRLSLKDGVIYGACRKFWVNGETGPGSWSAERELAMIRDCIYHLPLDVREGERVSRRVFTIVLTPRR